MDVLSCSKPRGSKTKQLSIHIGPLNNKFHSLSLRSQNIIKWDKFI